MELGKTIRLDLTKNNYLDYPETLKRVEEYILNRDINAVPIKSLALFNNPISLDEIRNEIPNFMPPQMYFVLDNHPKLKSLLEKQSLNKKLFVHNHNQVYYDNLAKSVCELEKTDEFKKLFVHNHNQVYYDNLAKSVYELEKTEEFKKLQSIHSNNDDFNNIKY